MTRTVDRGRVVSPAPQEGFLYDLDTEPLCEPSLPPSRAERRKHARQGPFVRMCESNGCIR
ncbi:hypothetical protein ACFW2Y_17960 [Streptomyces sp. NPDC058877]|uniref:hypothetical protein n=1 Tax=Streptomyces sp. NPDC058877 TaxID=3346665 RepID=UPI0036AFC9C5